MHMYIGHIFRINRLVGSAKEETARRFAEHNPGGNSPSEDRRR